MCKQVAIPRVHPRPPRPPSPGARSPSRSRRPSRSAARRAAPGDVELAPVSPSSVVVVADGVRVAAGVQLGGGDVGVVRAGGRAPDADGDRAADGDDDEAPADDEEAASGGEIPAAEANPSPGEDAGAPPA